MNMVEQDQGPERRVMASAKASAMDSESLQTLLLTTLDKDSTIPDSRLLHLTESAQVGHEPEEQQAIKGALDSLAGKQVSSLSLLHALPLSRSCLIYLNVARRCWPTKFIPSKLGSSHLKVNLS